MPNPNDYNTSCFPTWCPGCGNFAIWTALKNVFSQLKSDPSSTVLVYGIGCHGNMFNSLRTVNFEGLHGRTLPISSGIKLANHRLNVLAIAGDGDALGEGGNHLIHTCRRNHDITLIIHNNQLYSLTAGQASPTSPKGLKTKSTPKGVIEEPLNPLALAIVSGATFASRSFAGDIPHLTKIILEAIKHRGFSVVDVLQPCVTFNYLNTYQWYRERIYKLEENGYKTNDKLEAVKKTWETEKIPIGIFYQEERPTYEDQIPQIREKPLIEGKIIKDIKILLKEFS